uniref:LIM/homeobox protein Awh n=1 Tax=Parastrongyloides trichosuri TaxID=131310 RepID=A0A0N4ZK39_PARTI
MKIVFMDRASKLYKYDNDDYIQNHMYIERLKNFGLGYVDKTYFYDSYPSSPLIQTSTSVSSPNSTCDSNSNSSTQQQNGPNICAGCNSIIKEKFLYTMNNQFWHSSCLRCDSCSIILEQNPSCYVKDRKIYCKSCYDSKFYAKCSSCNRAIQSTDWVRKAQDNVYHLACFSCDQCKRQLSTGEEFGLQNDKLLCKQHYMELFDGDGNSSKSKAKRVRTTFADEQISVLQAHFQIDSNPDGADLERIANMTGLSKRVTQVWFQNSRARQKKYQGHKKGGNGTTNCSTVSGENNTSPSFNRPESLRSHTLSTTSGRSSPRSVSSPKTYRDDVMECNNNGQDASFSNQNMSLNSVDSMDDRNNLISTSFNMDCD